jgi:hypothetical protein
VVVVGWARRNANRDQRHDRRDEVDDRLGGV